MSAKFAWTVEPNGSDAIFFCGLELFGPRIDWAQNTVPKLLPINGFLRNLAIQGVTELLAPLEQRIRVHL